MRVSKRYLALAVAGVLLAACGHKDKDAPLAFVPADTPYVAANLEVLDEDTRNALIAQADAQLPGQLAQLKAAAEDMKEKDADTANLLKAFIAELDGKSIGAFAQNIGVNMKGHSAIYGLGLAPVLRFELADGKAFDAFVGRLETAYGKKLDTATEGGVTYRKHASAEAGTQVILAVVGKQAVAAVLPADAPQPLLRQALGLDRPAKNLQDDGRLEQLAKDKGYKPWAVGHVDLARLLPLAASGKDPLFAAMYKAHQQAESAKTGEPVATQPGISPACEADAVRIAGRVPAMSFGYTKLDPKHQDLRWDVALADDVTKAFTGLKVELPGLGVAADAPMDMSLALPVGTLRTFWAAQAEAVAAKPFGCASLANLNEGFAKLGQVAQQAAMPPFGDLLGLRVSLDSFDASSPTPKFTGRVLVATTNPAGLAAMGSMASPALAQLKLTPDGKPVALPPDMTAALGQPVWLAMGDKALAMAIGEGQDAKLGDMLKAPTGDAGQMGRVHLSGDMYVSWIKAMEEKSDRLKELTDSMNHEDGDDANKEETAKAQAAAERAKAQFETMRQQAERIKSISGEVHVEAGGMVMTTQTELK
ncbi:hypothetical protein KK141_06885 [Dyella sp. LX-66]|uniref:hypothetical protein n=1 Tax=unclassified Dyella TaxID=2634549 RepID=UPI001BE0AA59|nr:MULTISPECIES: hypothetical protein [unclassified Dyella]MBT2115436.1 hypothetical protein [Dyella sp. LX-1]MBT2139251.1 hypothetical protein [Dyella sp. LX-66]